MRVAPTGSSQSQCSVERRHQTLFSQVRALRLALAQRLQVPLQYFPVTHPTHSMDGKTCYVVTPLFLLHDDGLPSCQRRFKQEPTVGIAESGEMVLFKAHGKHDVAKSDSSRTGAISFQGRDQERLDKKTFKDMTTVTSTNASGFTTRETVIGN